MSGEGILPSLNRNPCRGTLLALAMLAPEGRCGSAGETQADICPTPVYGALTCSTSSCHGGAADKSRQYVIWSQRDVHSRSYATLGTARAARMAEALGIKSPLSDARCTSCHAPIATVAENLVMPPAKVSEGVSCVSCHGPLEGWLRSHTRPDYSHADRVAAGMRDLRSLDSRAGACVACHQNIEPALVDVGKHSPLIFELDGQTSAQPRHWREPDGRSGAQAWYVGQAVAWREISWGLRHGSLDAKRDLPRWRALRWLLLCADPEGRAEDFGRDSDEVTPAELARAEEVGRRLATEGARSWRPENTVEVLRKLAATASNFRDANTPLLHALRAERLVLALDRLLAAHPDHSLRQRASSQLDRLFQLAQSIPDFSPSIFARELEAFDRGIAESGKL